MSAKRAIKARAESQREKLDKKTAVASAKIPPARQTKDKLWGLCSPLAPSEYLPPLAGIAADLASRLEQEIARSLSHATAASKLEYEDCALLLMRVSPQLYSVVAEIRGLAAVKQPFLIRAETRTVEKECLPGVALVYDTLQYSGVLS